MVTEEVCVNRYNFNPIEKNKVIFKYVIKLPGAGSEIRMTVGL